MTTVPGIAGFVEPEFAACMDAFRQSFAEDGELGAACAIYRDGKPLLDVWAGWTGKTREVIWTGDTVAPVFSVTKGIAAICVLSLASRGLLDLDTPLAQYWPAFGTHGKNLVTVREALGHRAGVPVIDGPIALAELADTRAMSRRLAAQEPIFAPGSNHIYHALTIGWITSELVRRTTGLSLGAWLRANLAVPYGLNIQIGRTTDDTSPIADIEVPDDRDTPPIDAELIPARAIALNGLFPARLSSLCAAMSSSEFQQFELAGANGLADARSLARLYGLVLGSKGIEPLISSDCLAAACEIISEGAQFGIDMPGPTWGAGFMLPWPVQPMLGPGSFGHDGAGGSLAFAHAPSGISFAYVRNRTGIPNVEDAHVYRVVRALAHCLDIAIPTY
jgi:CubicO group peptidase (beta-lactamase class C family)